MKAKELENGFTPSVRRVAIWQTLVCCQTLAGKTVLRINLDEIKSWEASRATTKSRSFVCCDAAAYSQKQRDTRLRSREQQRSDLSSIPFQNLFLVPNFRTCYPATSVPILKAFTISTLDIR